MNNINANRFNRRFNRFNKKLNRSVNISSSKINACTIKDSAIVKNRVDAYTRIVRNHVVVLALMISLLKIMLTHVLALMISLLKIMLRHAQKQNA